MRFFTILAGIIIIIFCFLLFSVVFVIWFLLPEIILILFYEGIFLI
jgi:hypothetical protein